MATLKVFFPGRRYSSDRSFLYFLDRYIDGESVYLDYDVKRYTKDVLPLEENIDEAYMFSFEKLKDFDFSHFPAARTRTEYEDTVPQLRLHQRNGRRAHPFRRCDSALPAVRPDLPLFQGECRQRAGDKALCSAPFLVVQGQGR